MSESPIIKRSSTLPVACASLVVSSRLGLAVVLLLIVSVANNQLYGRGSGHNLAEARYLPTRSDESGVEVLKEIIRNLLTEAAEQHEAAAASSGRPFVRPTRFFSTQSRAGQQRQSYLVGRSNKNANNNNSNSSDNEQADELLLMPSAWQVSRSPAFIQRRLAELISGAEPPASRSTATSGLDRYSSLQDADQSADG